MTFDGISRQDMDFKPCTYLPLPPSGMTSLVHYNRRIDPMVQQKQGSSGGIQMNLEQQKQGSSGGIQSGHTIKSCDFFLNPMQQMNLEHTRCVLVPGYQTRSIHSVTAGTRFKNSATNHSTFKKMSELFSIGGGHVVPVVNNITCFSICNGCDV